MSNTINKNLKLTKTGEAFIRSKAANSELLTGKENHNLPNSSISNTPTIFTSIVKDVASYNNAPNLDTYNSNILSGVNGNNRLGELLIHWFNKYGQYYNVDPNVIAAQAFQESQFRTWAYSKTGALGLTQFVPATLFDTVIKVDSTLSGKFTTNEKNLIKLNLSGNTNTISSYSIIKGEREIGIHNRSILHQNLMNNPELAIKAQCVLMNFISNNNAFYVSSSLFCYNVGSYKKSKNFNELIAKNITTLEGGDEKVKEVNKYIRIIFKLLNDSFGYRFSDDELNLSVAKQGGAYVG
jgi:hypothetical protein